MEKSLVVVVSVVVAFVAMQSALTRADPIPEPKPVPTHSPGWSYLPDSKRVKAAFKDFENGRIVFIMGNHDLYFLNDGQRDATGPHHWSEYFKYHGHQDRYNPVDYTKITAAFSTGKDQEDRTLFFTENDYYVYKDGKPGGGPYKYKENESTDKNDLPNFKFDCNIDATVDAVADDKVFFFCGNKYWRFDNKENKMDDNYPQPISKWSKYLKGIPNIDAAFSTDNRNIYLISGEKIYKFDNRFQPEVSHEYPKEGLCDEFNICPTSRGYAGLDYSDVYPGPGGPGPILPWSG